MSKEKEWELHEIITIETSESVKRTENWRCNTDSKMKFSVLFVNGAIENIYLTGDGLYTPLPDFLHNTLIDFIDRERAAVQMNKK